jgi:predicted AlkP superfamily pyrophosphatase or phosphodiesterase
MKYFLSIVLLVAGITATAQTKVNTNTATIKRPKLVVGIMIDQMRWDYLYRFQNRYSANGFKRLMNEGFSCDNTLIPYAYTVTAAGHSSVYTGSVPALNGIVGNDWYDKQLGRDVYCTEDKSVSIVGPGDKKDPQSPKNLWTTTICDELRLATNFKSKVIGIAIKDRGGILPAGHSANAAYWYDGTSGNWISSTYYMQQLPAWVDAFNNKKAVDSFYNKNWNTLYPIKTYTQSTDDNKLYEGKFAHEKEPVFPHELQSRMGKDYGTIRYTPYGNSLTIEFAKSALAAEHMGQNGVTDFLAMSLSSTDYVGHQFGPNSIEIEDTYLRLDADLAGFLTALDKQVGKGEYVVFLTADHAVAHVAGFMQENKLPGKSLTASTGDLNSLLEKKYGLKNIIKAGTNYQFYLNHAVIDSAKLSENDIKQTIVAEVNKDENVLTAFDNASIANANLPHSIREMYQNSFTTKRSGDVQVVLKPGNYQGGKTGTTHGAPFAYDTHIPLLFFGWGIQHGNLFRETYMTDIASTIAALLKIQMPSGSVGHVITEVLK